MADALKYGRRLLESFLWGYEKRTVLVVSKRERFGPLTAPSKHSLIHPAYTPPPENKAAIFPSLALA